MIAYRIEGETKRMAGRAALGGLWLALWLTPAHALDPVPMNTKAEMTVTWTYKATATNRNSPLAPGDMYADTATSMVAKAICPLFASGVETAGLEGPSAEVEAANRAQGQAVEKQVTAMQGAKRSSTEDMAAKVEACIKSGKGEQACAMEAFSGMMADPSVANEAAAMNKAAGQHQSEIEAANAQLKQAAGAGYQMWYSSECTGTLTVNEVTTYTQTIKTAAGPPPPRVTQGSEVLELVDSAVRIETDLGKSQTRYLLIQPAAAGFQTTGGGQPPRESRLTIPVRGPILGPFAGPAKNGRIEEKVANGSYVIEWTFSRR